MNVESVKGALGEYVDDFKVQVEDNYITVRATHYIMDKEEYSEVGRRMRKINAEYIKEPKNIHWRILVGVVEANPKLAVEGNILDRLDRAIDVLQICLRDLNEVKKALKEK